MPATAAKAVVLAKPPIKGSKLSEDLFEVVDVELPPLGEGELLIRTIYASVDPFVSSYFPSSFLLYLLPSSSPTTPNRASSIVFLPTLTRTLRLVCID